MTEAGKIIYEGTQKIKTESKSLILKAKDTEQANRIIRIGSSLLRSSNPILDLWSRIGNQYPEYQLDIVPFQDDPLSMKNMFLGLGKTLDAFAGLFDYSTAQLDKENYNFVELQPVDLAWGIPKNNPLSKKDTICLDDLEGQTILLVKAGYSKILDSLRQKLVEKKIKIIDFDSYYDITAFNECVQKNYIMETLSIWRNVHPSMVNVQMENNG